MNSVSGSIHFKWVIDVLNIDFPLHIVTTDTEEGVNIFFYGITPCATSEEVLRSFTDMVGLTVLSHDISIATEEKVKIYIEGSVSGQYTRMSFEGKGETFESVLAKFENSSPHIISIREAEVSPLFGNKVIKIDIVY